MDEYRQAQHQWANHTSPFLHVWICLDEDVMSTHRTWQAKPVLFGSGRKVHKVKESPGLDNCQDGNVLVYTTHTQVLELPYMSNTHTGRKALNWPTSSGCGSKTEGCGPYQGKHRGNLSSPWGMERYVVTG